MVWVVIIISIIYIIMLALILQAYYKNISDIEDRVLNLEKRLNSVEKEIGSYEIWSENCDNLQGININNTWFLRMKEGDNMPCGRKGRPKGSKNTGGGKRK